MAAPRGGSIRASETIARMTDTAISAVQALLSASPTDYTALQNAAANLRSQLQAAGLM